MSLSDNDMEPTENREAERVPAVSVVMSVFNGGRFLRQAVDSILAQSFRDFEFIIIDDGSTDESAKILMEYARSDARIRFYSQQNKGLVDSLNRGCALARGKYVARMDADDIAVMDRLWWQVDFMERHPEVGLLGGAAEFIDENNKTICVARYPTTDREIQQVLLDGNVFWHPSVLLCKAALKSVGLYRKITDAEDYDLWLRMAEQIQVANLPQIILRYRIHPGQISVAKCREQALGAGAAQMSARMRRAGETDPLSAGGEITSVLLAGLNIDESAQQTALARGYLSCIRNMCRIGEHERALSALQIVHSQECALAESWIHADSYVWEARLHWQEKRPIRCAFSLWRAIAARPLILGRPLKAVFRWVRSVSRAIVAPSLTAAWSWQKNDAKPTA